MPFIPVPNVASFELIYTCFGQKIENVLNVSAIAEWTVEKLTDIAGVFSDWWTSDGADVTPSNVTLIKIVAKSLDSDSAPAIEYVGGLPLDGSLGGTDMCPLNVTACVSFGTALRGRSFRGRVYHPGLRIGDVSGNTIVSGHRTLLIAAWSALIDQLNTASVALVVVSRYHANSPRTSGICTPIISVSCDPNVDSQRRRLTGRGQ